MPHSPAPLERIRLPVARWLLKSRPCVRWGLDIIPNSHPFKPFAASTYEDLDEFTDLALQPRNSDGVKIIQNLNTTRNRKRFATLLATSYLLVAQVVTAFPAIVVYHGAAKLHPFVTLGVTEDPVDVPRLHVYVTPQKLDH